MGITELHNLYNKFRDDRKEIADAIDRLDQRHAHAVEQYNSAVQDLSTSLESWARGNLAEEALSAAYTKVNTLKPMTDIDPFRRAKEPLDAEIKSLEETYQKQRRETVIQERVTEYKKLFNAAVNNSRRLSRDEVINLRSTVTNDYQHDLDKLFAALIDYCFKFRGHSSAPTFQEYSKIDYYPVSDAA